MIGGADTAHRSAFASRHYRRYFPAAVFSTLGSWTLRFLLGWSAWELTRSAAWVGAVAGLTLAPSLILSPLWGILSDRINPRNGLLLTVGIHAALAALAGVAVLAGQFSLSTLLLLAAALGTASSAHAPIRLAMVPSLVPRASLPSAIGYSATVFNTSRILGPALGAWLLQTGSAAFAYFTAAVLMSAALPFLLSVPGIRRGTGLQASTGLRAQLLAGLSYAREDASIRLILGFTLVNAMLGRTVIELLPALSGKLLDGDSTTLATLTASAGAGAIVGGLVVSRQGSGEKRLFYLLVGSLALGVVLLGAMAWAVGPAMFAVLIGALGLATTMAGTTSQALAQLLVEDAYRGRVLSLWTMLVMGVPALGALLMGWLADRFSFPPALLLFALAGVAMLAWLIRHLGALHFIPPRG